MNHTEQISGKVVDVGDSFKTSTGKYKLEFDKQMKELNLLIGLCRFSGKFDEIPRMNTQNHQ